MSNIQYSMILTLTIRQFLFQNGFKFKERKTFIGDKDLYFKYAVHHKTEKPRNRPRVCFETMRLAGILKCEAFVYTVISRCHGFQ